MEQKKVVLITGGSRGIGQGIALELAREGYDVAFSYHENLEGAEQTRKEVEALGAACRIYQASMENLEEAVGLVDTVRDDFGRLDAIVCNAARDRRFSILNVTAEQIEFMARQLYCAQMLCAGAAARHMVRDGIHGSIVFITSIHGQMSNTDDFLYGGMKAAIERSCRSLALELSPYRIRVNCVAPGAINVRNTDDTTLKYPYSGIVPHGRRGVPEDIAYAVGFLISEHADYITGETLRVDGGMALPGQPEGWAQAHPVNTVFVERNYQEMMKNEEEEKNV